MDSLIEQLIEFGLSKSETKKIVDKITLHLKKSQYEQCWREILKMLGPARLPFPLYKLIYEKIYPDWDKIPAPAWFPDKNFIKTTNIVKSMQKLGLTNYDEFHRWSVTQYAEFWQLVVDLLNIKFDQDYEAIVDLSDGMELPHWFQGAKLNIVNSCFKANQKDIAIIEQGEEGDTRKTTYGELDKLSNRVANSISKHLKVGDRIAIIMPMTMEAIAIYLGIIKAGCCVVSIPDSFTANEITNRLRIAKVKAIFTQNKVLHKGKHLPLYEKIIDANAPLTILLSIEKKISEALRKQDIHWQNFLDDDDHFTAVSCYPEDHTNILFSSGTMGEPKAIPWTHTTPVKCGSDAYFHHNVQNHDIICWPSNLGWMMGPWLIYACLLNNATIALYDDIADGKKFGKFIQDNKISILGLIPTHVNKWRHSSCMEEYDWSRVKLFSSTGECSNIEDMLYLMWLGHNRPIVEYCGGTEIGGAYITGTVIQPCAPSAFTTPALGIDFKIMDEFGLPVDKGEVALIPPSIGLSTEILNKDHHQIYYSNMPKRTLKQMLRRHSDCVEQFSNGFYRLHGRTDDTMNLGGMKVSSTEIESVLNKHPTLAETAAIAVIPPGGGPSQLYIYAIPARDEKLDAIQLKVDLQKRINQSLNPLFKIHEVIIVNFIPRTASNKIMRRVLRENFKEDNTEKLKTAKIHPVKTKKICLALQGGGAYGAYTWGILDRFLEDERIEIDAISATSAGSVNAVLLANGMYNGGNEGARRALNDFWQTLGQYGSYLSPIGQMLPMIESNLDLDMTAQISFVLFDTITRTYSPYMLNPFDFDITRLILLEKVNFKNLKRNPIKLFLSATNVKTGMLKVFENANITVDSVLASACLPHLRQAVKINEDYYWDGGYLGNPAIYPLIYNSQIDDILIIHNNPIVRETVPIHSTDIASRVNEISFNSSLIRELRSIAFVTKLIDKGWIKDEYKETIRRKFVHIIRSDEIMNRFKLINKFNWHFSFLSHLRDLGREEADKWLKVNFEHIGKKPTLDFSEFLSEDTQTS